MTAQPGAPPPSGQPPRAGIPPNPRPPGPRDAGHAALPGSRHRRALLRPADLHRLPDLLQRAGAGGDLPAGGGGRGGLGQAAAAHLERHRVGPRLDDRAHRLHLRDQRRLADALAPAGPAPRRRGVRPAEPALREVQGRVHDAADDRGRGRPGHPGPVRGTGRRRVGALRRPGGGRASRARTPASSSPTRPARTSS